MSTTAYEWLTQRLVLLDIPPGAPINEQQVMAQAGVGRTPLREALKRLESDHLVVSYPRRGTFATPVDIATLTEISEIRGSLEPLASRLAAQRIDEHDRAVLQSLQVEVTTAAPRLGPRDLMELDQRVHRALHAAAHNTHLQLALERYGNLATRIWSVAAIRLGSLDAHILDLDPLVGAVLDQDAGLAERLMRAHMGDFEKRIRSVL